MDDTHCKQTIFRQDGTKVTKLVDEHYPVHFLEAYGEVRNGLKKGLLKKATFELQNGNTIIYEATGEKRF